MILAVRIVIAIVSLSVAMLGLSFVLGSMVGGSELTGSASALLEGLGMVALASSGFILALRR